MLKTETNTFEKVVRIVSFYIMTFYVTTVYVITHNVTNITANSRQEFYMEYDDIQSRDSEYHDITKFSKAWHEMP